MKTVVYTALFGAYDTQLLEMPHTTKEFDFICYTNMKHLKSDTWKMIYIDKDPVSGDNARSAYYYKTNPHKVLDKKYEVSVWVDSSINRLDLSKLSAMVDDFKNKSVSMFIEKHPGRKCVYQELKANIHYKKDDVDAMTKHVESYKSEGMPIDFGMVETGFQIRNHKDAELIEFQEALWHEITTKTRRDQLSWNYVAWKKSFTNFHLFTFDQKIDMLWFQDHPNRVSHKEKVLLVGPWLGENKFESQWVEYVKSYIAKTPIDTIMVGCRPGSQNLYDKFADKYIINDPTGNRDRHLLDGKVPRFNVKTNNEKEIVQLNPVDSVCLNFKSHDRLSSKIHILWCTVRPKVFNKVYTEWLEKATDPSRIVLHAGVDSVEDKFETGFPDSTTVINNRRKGVAYPSYVLSSQLQADENDIVVFASDDFHPMDNWDDALYGEFEKTDGALLVNDKYPNNDAPIITIPILTYTALLKMNKVLYHPDYSHCWSDNELYDNLTELRLLKDISKTSPEIYFEHRHFSNHGRPIDEHDSYHQKTDAEGRQLYLIRKGLPLKTRLEAKRVISFSLWGDDKKYTNGAIENVKIQKDLYPNWVCRFYYDETVPQVVIDTLEYHGAELVFKDKKSEGSNGLAWRFEVGFDDTVDRFIIRDTDSRLSIRELYAVNEWIESGKSFHVMRDHENHGVPILGGMWGGIKNFLPDFENLYTEWVTNLKATNHERDTYFNSDQIFLWNDIWDRVKDDHMAHDDKFNFTGQEKPFPFEKLNDCFVGQAFDEHDNPIFDY
jgi:hypothetical protein